MGTIPQGDPTTNFNDSATAKNAVAQQSTNYDPPGVNAVSSDADRNYDSRYQTVGGKNKAMFDTASNLGEAVKGTGWAVGQKNRGGLANSLRPNPDQGNLAIFDVVKDYKWAFFNNNQEIISEVPYVYIIEYLINESALQRQAAFYTRVAADVGSFAATRGAGRGSTSLGALEMYKEVIPKEREQRTGFEYKFPYFSKNMFNLSSSWKAQNEIGDSVEKLAGKKGQQIKEVGAAAANVALGAAGYPSIGVVDRPQIFEAHSQRSITIEFTLFNTDDYQDWQNNRELAYTLMSQNHFNKKDYVTGIPPVFYDVWIPGQYYSYASYMTDITVNQVGNQRLISDGTSQGHIVPDAYEFKLTLKELTFPSKNQFEAIINGQASANISVNKR